MEGRILKGAMSAGAIVRQPVLQAAEEAKEILERAQQERDRLRQEAQAQGYREGFHQWDTAISHAQQAAKAYLHQHQQDFVRLAVRVAEKILGDSLLAHPDQVSQIVQEALRNLSRERRLTIEVAPGQGAVLERHRSQLEARVGQDCVLRILESSEVSPGGCLLRSELGTIDARVETQLALLERALLAEVAHNQPELPAQEPAAHPQESVDLFTRNEEAQ